MAASGLRARGAALELDGAAPHLAHKVLKRPGEQALSTLDARVQRFAVSTLRRHLRELGGRNVEDGALVVLDNATGDVLAWVGSQISPAWANRYLAAGVAPFLLVAAAGFAHAGRLGLVGLALVAVLWAIDGAPSEKSNVREVAESIAPSLRPGDLVVATQPEQVPVLHRYLPAGVAYLTPLGTPADPSLTDWRDALPRLRAASAERVLLPRVRALAPGRRVVLVVPVAESARSRWSRAVRRRTAEWRAALHAELRPVGATSRPDPTHFRSTIRAEIFEVVR